MSKSIVLILSMSLFGQVVLAAPTDTTVNQWVSLALADDFDKLDTNSGRVQCSSMMGRYQGRGESVEDAHAKAVLLCIRAKCEGVQAQVNTEIDRMRGIQESELVDMLTALGLGDDRAEQVLKVLGNGGYGGTTNCKSSQGARYMAYDICVAQPYNCN
jgi:hypothetical protein